ncbi:predicted protein [Naegleria gruberi]|uniref:Predicted protein n=1 Tax=Naegleria gruberi TaxID=5762 RepID=D2V3W2_NAEGR|nr:uncharacterized protein NAEGRDRAFT_63511 [Naegleria gruberi]EFC48267.1 predicted protein [Naegleria gruberi]|eukprot:XP_002681011.1 predicted protein [Naegleria gruberi strain NEG-M]
MKNQSGPVATIVGLILLSTSSSPSHNYKSINYYYKSLIIYLIFTIFQSLITVHAQQTFPPTLNYQGYQLLLSKNQLLIRATTSTLLTSNNLGASLSSPSEIQGGFVIQNTVFYVQNVIGGSFELVTTTTSGTNSSSVVTSFSSEAIQQGRVYFVPNVGLDINLKPSYSVWAQGLLVNSSTLLSVALLNSTTISSAQVTFTRWNTGLIGAPKPVVFNRSNSTHVIIEVNMFKRNIDGPPASSFMVGLANSATCTSDYNTVLNSLSDGFVKSAETETYQTFVLIQTIAAHLANPNVVKISKGIYIDVRVSVFMTYMITNPGSSCQRIQYTEDLITQANLIAQQNGNSNTPQMSLTPTRLIVSDSSQLLLSLLLTVTGLNTANLFNWQLTGPKAFTLNYPILADVQGDTKYWQFSFASNSVSDGEDFSGTYTFKFEAQVSGEATSKFYQLSITLQYSIPDGEGVSGGGGLPFDTEINTYYDNNFGTNQPQTQIKKTQQAFIKVSTVLISTSLGTVSPIPSSKQIAPYNIFICCTKNFQAMPSNQCRQYDATVMTYQKQLMINGTISSDSDVVSKFKLKSPETIKGITDWGTLRHIYAFSMYMTALVTGVDKRCYLAIDTYLVNADLPVLRGLQANTLSAASNISTSTRAFDLIEVIAATSSSKKPQKSVHASASKKNGFGSVDYICDSSAPSTMRYNYHIVVVIIFTLILVNVIT